MAPGIRDMMQVLIQMKKDCLGGRGGLRQCERHNLNAKATTEALNTCLSGKPEADITTQLEVNR